MTLTWLNRRSDPILELQLAEENEIVESLQLNPIQQSVRIRCDGYNQVFFLDNTRAWQDQVIFTNAYGIESGILKFERYPLLSGTLHLEEQQFRFTHNTSDNSISVYRVNSREHSLTVALPLENSIPGTSLPIINQKLEMEATMLLGICWNLLKTAEPAEVVSAGRQLLSWMR